MIANRFLTVGLNPKEAITVLLTFWVRSCSILFLLVPKIEEMLAIFSPKLSPLISKINHWSSV